MILSFQVIRGAFTWEEALQKCWNKSTETSAETLEADVDLSSSAWDICTNYNMSVKQTLWLGIRTLLYYDEYKNEGEGNLV
jgi:hypothetical protein